LIAQSRGWHLKELPGRLPVEQFPKRKGLAESTLHAKAKSGMRAPRKVAEYLMTEEGLPTRDGYKTTAKVVRLGFAVLNGLPSPTIGKKLDAVGTNLDGNGGKLDTLLTEVAAIRAVLKGGLHVTGTVLGIVRKSSLPPVVKARRRRERTSSATPTRERTRWTSRSGLRSSGSR
jgi:hypothetical protein